MEDKEGRSGGMWKERRTDRHTDGVSERVEAKTARQRQKQKKRYCHSKI